MRYLIIAFVFFICANFVVAQYRAPQQSNQSRSSNASFADKVYFGGGGGFSGGQDYLNLSLTPIVGYKITDAFSAGVQITYQYVKIQNIKLKNYGAGPFLRYNVTDKFFGYTEYEYLNYGFLGFSGIERLNFYSWFCGIGYSEPINKNVAFNVTALYNVLYGDGSKSPYTSPFVFRAGIVVGL
jgi:hypothetical protein